jgi:hypothetical protein
MLLVSIGINPGYTSGYADLVELASQRVGRYGLRSRVSRNLASAASLL